MTDARWPQNLWDPRVSAGDADHRPVLGVMARYVGHQYSVEELWQHYRNHADVHPKEEAELRPLSRRIRAFDVPLLTDVTFHCGRLEELAPTLTAVVGERLPGTTWGPFDQLHQFFLAHRVAKYAIIHSVMPAPVDEATQEAMVLELFGRLETVNGEPVGIGWYPNPPADDGAVGDMAFRLTRGTYANTRTPGIGVPFYM